MNRVINTMTMGPARCLALALCLGLLSCSSDETGGEAGEATTCEAGAEGCACLEGTCGANELGQLLTCQNDRCSAASCPSGSAGCACVDKTTCDDGLSCSDGLCVEGGCTPGSLNCQCAGGLCDDGLLCRQGVVCVDGAGLNGGPCYANGSCERGNACLDGVCAICTLGSRGCGCTDSGGCFTGNTCWNSLCVDSTTLPAQIPDEPLCYTRCSEGFFDETLDEWRACPYDGLMEGCLSSQECVDGTCTEPGGSARTCGSDNECPEWQACMNGTCYSNCENDDDCGAGTECHQYVCRMPCTSSDSSDCTGDTACELTDGTGGYCMPVLPANTASYDSVEGGMSVDPTAFDLSNVTVTVNFVISNDSDASQTFRVRKLEHTISASDGTAETLRDYDDDETCDPATTCPLWWVSMGESGSELEPVDSIEVVIAGNGSAEISLSVGDVEAATWSGTLEIISDVGSEKVFLSWADKPDGQWRGTVFYYSQFQDENLAEWAADRTNNEKLLEVRNAFVQRWGAFRQGIVTWQEMQAVMTATENETWEAASTLDECQVETCYYWEGASSGVGDYSNDLEATPIPSGMTELPVAMNLWFSSSDPGRVDGRIESSGTLHYAGDPAVTLSLSGSPDDCDVTDKDGACLVYVETFAADIAVGGRYLTTSADTSCSKRAGQGFEHFQIPWLIPGFTGNASTDDSGLAYTWECRDSLLPFSVDDSAEPAVAEAANLSLAGANPIPDARTRFRELRLVDGVMVSSSTIVILFEERMSSFLDANDTDGISAYGYMMLEKQPTDLDTADDDNDGVPNDFEGAVITDTRSEPSDVLDVQCSEDVLAQIPGIGGVLDESTAPTVIQAIITGVAATSAAGILDENSAEQVHYYCEDTGLFDGGPANTTPHGIAWGVNDNSCPVNITNVCQDGGPNAQSAECELGTDLADCGTRYTDDLDVKVTCPAGSKVIFFTVDEALATQAEIAAEGCQSTGSCLDTLIAWEASGAPVVNMDPVYRCEGGGAYCDLNRQDLRDGKQFYETTESSAVFESFRAGIESAFRYRVRFRSRDGDSPGFAPELCVEDSNQVPYCYEPSEIEALADRLDCLLAIWRDHSLALDASDDPNVQAAAELLHGFLEFSFSTEADCPTDPNVCTTYDGFERLFAELLIMMGDESYTEAFGSRFDLAATQTTSFEGELWEEGGVNLSGVAGHEMAVLHQAAQYYQMVLDRFYARAPMLWTAVVDAAAEAADTEGTAYRQSFVSPGTVTTYLDRVLRASSQKSRAWSEIANKYNSFNEPELARTVIERAYAATYLESVAIGRLMQRVRDSFQDQEKPQIDQVLENSQRRFRLAMLDMRKAYESITDETTVFGLDPDYIPFPTLNNVNFGEDNAFQKLLNKAWQRMELAKAREQLAIDSDRSYETDAASFQSELTRIRVTYEDQLGDLCGTFVADDGYVYPATARYSSLHERTAQLGDPCGMVGNGQLYTALVNVDLARLSLQQLMTRYANTLESIDIEEERVAAQCGLIDGLASYVLCAELGEECSNVPTENQFSTDAQTLEDVLRVTSTIRTTADRALQAATTVSKLAKCSVIAGTSVGGDCPAAGVAASVFAAATVVNERIQLETQILIDNTEKELSEMRVRVGVYQTQLQCDQFKVDSTARMKEMMLSLRELDLEILRAQYELQLALSEIQRLNNQAKRLQLEQTEAEQMAIDIEAARNDPNIRIYRNDAVLNADISFEDAVKQAYRATKVYEYYTSTSYAARDQLYLIRMITSGEYNLENYLVELENSFLEFEEEFGEPDVRVEMLSLRDDILAIPWSDDDGTALDNGTRIQMLRDVLTDPANLDSNGYVTIPFSTSVDQLSPLTRNHKISYIEVNLSASEIGDDDVGRIYLRQKGTSVVHAVDDSTIYYRFPERLAVVDVYFGSKFFDEAIYKSYRFRDRPFANTQWELAINLRDEPANKGIDLATVSDIQVFVYYSDFTTY